jgi:hypothetical protein
MVKKALSLARWRIAIGYSVIGVPGMGLVIAKTIQDILNGINLHIPIYILFPAGVVTLFVAGYIWDVFGFYQIEAAHGFERAKFFRETSNDRDTDEE